MLQEGWYYNATKNGMSEYRRLIAYYGHTLSSGDVAHGTLVSIR